MADDPKITQRYRDLGREEPPRHLDDAILAASRRAVDSRPAPLVVPTGPRRWYFPLAAAAVIVLAVAVTLHVERERPSDAEMAVAQAPAPMADKPAAKAFVPDPKPAAESPAELQKSQRAESVAAAPAATPAPLEPQRQAEVQERAQAAARADSEAEQKAKVGSREPARAESQRKLAEQAAAERAPAAAVAKPALGAEARARMSIGAVAAQSPEQWLQGIADLRRQGRHEEADKALAEFRRAYPEYRLTEEMRAKIEREPVRAR